MFVKYNKANVLGVAGVNETVIFKPGVNEVSKESWEKIIEDPSIKQKISAGFLVVMHHRDHEVQKAQLSIEPSVAREELEVDETLDKLNAHEAASIIETTFDFELLQKWKALEERKGVLKAIDKQLDIIEGS